MLPDSLSIAVAVGLVFLNGFFTAAELSMARVRNTRIEELVQAGDWRARAVRGHQAAYFLSATQLESPPASTGEGELPFAHVVRAAPWPPASRRKRSAPDNAVAVAFHHVRTS
jgi:hypothetical protein